MISSATTLVGVIGDPVSHSLSPRMQNAAFEAAGLDWAYVPLRVAPERLGEALRGLAGLSFAGANVTIPHKEGVAALVDETTDVARAAGSVNTIVVRRDGSLLGDSTDGAAVTGALAATAGDGVLRGRVLVLGAGGSARAVVAALSAAGADVGVWSRRPEAAADARDRPRRDRPRPPAGAAAARDRQLHAARRSEGAHGVAAGSRFSLRCPSRLRPRLPPRRGADRPLPRRRRSAASPSSTASRCSSGRAPARSRSGRASSPIWTSCAAPSRS